VLGVAPDEHGLFFDELRACLGEGLFGKPAALLGPPYLGGAEELEKAFDLGYNQGHPILARNA